MLSNIMRDEHGQGTLEAALVIPVLFVILLLLLQPGIILYDRIVMGNAAAEGCRLLATANGSMQGSCEAFVRHRLASIPQHDCFHVHKEGCSWNIELIGDETSETTTVRISNEVHPLPLFDMGTRFIGLANDRGNIEVKVEVTAPTQPNWVASSPTGTSPSDWIGAWLD